MIGEMHVRTAMISYVVIRAKQDNAYSVGHPRIQSNGIRKKLRVDVKQDLLNMIGEILALMIMTNIVGNFVKNLNVYIVGLLMTHQNGIQRMLHADAIKYSLINTNGEMHVQIIMINYVEILAKRDLAISVGRPTIHNNGIPIRLHADAKCKSNRNLQK